MRFQAASLILTLLLALATPQSLYADPPWYTDGVTVSTTTELTISPPSPVQIIGEPVTLTATVGGAQISGVTVSFYVDGTLIGTALTDASTQASFTFDTSLFSEGEHTFRADFPETEVSRLTGTHVRIYVVDVNTGQQTFLGYFDTYERDRALASWAQLSPQFRASGQPFVFSQPINHIVPAGSDVRLQAGIVARSPLFYQWRIGESVLLGETNATLVMFGVQTTQAGIYSVVASNSAGTNISSPASLTVFTVSTGTLENTFGLDHFSILISKAAPEPPPQLICYEGVDYTPTNVINGLNGGLGWTSPWTGSNNVGAGGLTFIGLPTSGNRFTTDGNTVGSFRLLPTAGFEELLEGGRYGRDGTTLWISFLFRPDANEGDTYAGLSLFDGPRYLPSNSVGPKSGFQSKPWTGSPASR